MKQWFQAVKRLPPSRRRVITALAVAIIVTWMAACLVLAWALAT